MQTSEPGNAAVVDPIIAEIIAQSLCAIPNVIDKNITRTAYSLLVSEYKDFAVGIVDGDGRLISQCKGGLPVFCANALSVAVRDGLRHYGKSGLQTGDVVMTNQGAVMGQHLNNVVMYTPIRCSESDDGLLGFMVIVMHWMDIGGYAVGSCTSTKTTDVFQEGIQFPSLKLLSRGERVREIYRLIETNTRFPQLTMGDMESQVAGCLMGRDMVMEVINKFGLQTVRVAIDRFWQRTETAVRNAIRAIPDGLYEASSFLDDDGIDLSKTLPIKVSVCVQGDEITVDLSGLAKQVAGPWNAGYQGGAVAAVRIACKYFFLPEGTATDGAYRPIKVVCPLGTIMSASATAALSGSGHNLPTIVDTILKALAQAVPNKVPAGHPGTYASHVIVGRTADHTGWFQHIEAAAGGWGATNYRDGTGPFRSMAHGDTPEVPVELQEASYPYRLQCVRLRTDSGGVGKFRGGLGILRIFHLLHPVKYTVMIDRTKCPPWGLEGGGDGATSRADIYRDGKCIATLIKDDATLHAGDEIHFYSSGGGGYGDPLLRPLEKVIEDVRCGYVSRESGANDYGVLLDDEFECTQTQARLKKQPLRP